MATWTRQLSLLLVVGVTFSSLMTTTALAESRESLRTIVYPRKDIMARSMVLTRVLNAIRDPMTQHSRAMPRSTASQLRMALSDVSESVRGSKRNIPASRNSDLGELCSADTFCDCEQPTDNDRCTTTVKCPRHLSCNLTDATFCFMVTKSFPWLHEVNPATARYDYTVSYTDGGSQVHNMIDNQSMAYNTTFNDIVQTLINVLSQDQYPSAVNVTVRNHLRSCPNA